MVQAAAKQKCSVHNQAMSKHGYEKLAIRAPSSSISVTESKGNKDILSASGFILLLPIKLFSNHPFHIKAKSCFFLWWVLNFSRRQYPFLPLLGQPTLKQWYLIPNWIESTWRSTLVEWMTDSLQPGQGHGVRWMALAIAGNHPVLAGGKTGRIK
jgi:hypothetical protein